MSIRALLVFQLIFYPFNDRKMVRLFQNACNKAKLHSKCIIKLLFMSNFTDSRLKLFHISFTEVTVSLKFISQAIILLLGFTCKSILCKDLLFTLLALEAPIRRIQFPKIQLLLRVPVLTHCWLQTPIDHKCMRVVVIFSVN